MIIGSGLIASTFNKLASETLLKNFIVFASGVSNSSKNDTKEFDREKTLLIDTIKSNNLPIIYFSSILVNTSNSPYYNHKLNMENVIKEHTNNYLILRIPQVIGIGGNKNTLFNFIKTSIETDQIITTNEKVERALIDVDDLVKIVDVCKDFKGTLRLSSIEKINMVDLCNIIGKNLRKIPKLNIEENLNFDNWTCENSDYINIVLNELNIERNGYTERLVKKYI